MVISLIIPKIFLYEEDIVMNFNIKFNIGEGLEPSLFNDIFDLICSNYIINLMMNYYGYMADYIDVSTKSIDIEIGINKYNDSDDDNHYVLDMVLLNNGFSVQMYQADLKSSIFSTFRNILIIALYQKNIVGKYVVRFEQSHAFSHKVIYPVGIKTMKFSTEALLWVFSTLCEIVDRNNDVETFDKMFEVMSPEQFKDVKDLMYKYIMHEKGDGLGDIGYFHIYKNELRARFISWCNKFAIENTTDDIIEL